MAYTGFVIVRLDSKVPVLRGPDDLQEAAESAGYSALARLIAYLNFAGKTSRLVPPRPGKGAEAVKAIRLHTYWRLDARGKSNVEDIANQLNQSPDIELAYRELAAADPHVAVTDPLQQHQNYLDAAPVGIEARWAWGHAHGDGSGVALFDVEQHWNLNHEDLVGWNIRVLHGDVLTADHGTQALGVIVGRNNSVGVIGAAPHVRDVYVASHHIDSTGSGVHVAAAIESTFNYAEPGDVLLLEVCRLDDDFHLPTEVDPADFDAIREAVSRGLIVIEAAGNADRCLDDYVDQNGHHVLNRNDDEFRDSGAIMVGASESRLNGNGHDRWVFSSYGSRVDCYAWGENVVSCGVGNYQWDSNSNKRYTDSFDGTSAASAIIAGAALQLQSIFKTKTGSSLSPEQMRRFLTDEATGTPQVSFFDERRIGVMPNLRAIVEEYLYRTPDIFVRNSADDTGVPPALGPLASSPDIAVFPYRLDDRNGVLDEFSGTEALYDEGLPLEPGRDHYVYVRINNRGLGEARGVRARVYWSEVASLITPDMCNLIGVTGPVDIPLGAALRAIRPLKWRPPVGVSNCCFLAVIRHSLDPDPIPHLEGMSWEEFLAFGQHRNNVAWRNYGIFDVPPSGGALSTPFKINGANDRQRDYHIEFSARPSCGSGLYVDLPASLWGGLASSVQGSLNGQQTESGDYRVQLVDALDLGTVQLDAGEEHLCEVVLTGQYQETRSREVTLRQSSGPSEVGRITWLFRGQGTGPARRPWWWLGRDFGRSLARSFFQTGW